MLSSFNLECVHRSPCKNGDGNNAGRSDHLTHHDNGCGTHSVLILPVNRSNLLDLRHLALKALDPHLVTKSDISAIHGVDDLARNICAA